MKRRTLAFFDDWEEFDDWEDDEDWDEFEAENSAEYWEYMLLNTTMLLADTVFLSDEHSYPWQTDEYNLGFVEPQMWWPLVEQLADMTDLDVVATTLESLEDLLNLEGVPSHVLENPLGFLTMILDGHLPHEPSGRKVGSPKLVKIAREMVNLLLAFPEPAQAAVRAWANIQRGPTRPFPVDMWSPTAVRDLLETENLPPPIAGFSALIALSIMLWPERGEGLSMPPHPIDSDYYEELLSLWEDLPDSPTVTEEGVGSAEALFAQGQLAHMLAQAGSIELEDGKPGDGEDLTLIYSRLSRAILWLHNQCRHCPERHGLTCKAATGWTQRPTPLIDLASEIANTGHISGCVRM